MTYSEIVEALTIQAIDENEALALTRCDDLLELCELAVIEQKLVGQIHDVPMTVPYSRMVICRTLH